MNQSSTLSAGTASHGICQMISGQHVFSILFPIRRGYRCDRLLRTRIGGIVGIPRAKAEEYLAAPAEESTRGPAQLGDPMDLQPGQ